jgi:hypothetical protein
MKKALLTFIASCSMLAFFTPTAKAQVSLSINIGNWAPPAEYAGVDYYYLPDVESYYYAPRRQFVYLDGGHWVFRDRLPARYATYRLDRGYKIAMNRPRAYRYFRTDRARYGRYRGSSHTTIIRGNSYRSVKRVNVYRGKPGRGPGHGHGGPGHGGGHGHGRH